jgi:hypothetical protein
MAVRSCRLGRMKPCEGGVAPGTGRRLLRCKRARGGTRTVRCASRRVAQQSWPAYSGTFFVEDGAPAPAPPGIGALGAFIPRRV